MMKLHIVERQVSGREDTSDLLEQLREIDTQISSTAELLVNDGDFTWSGAPLSGYGQGEVMAEGGSVAVEYGYDDGSREWLLLRQGANTYEMYRMVRVDSEESPVVQVLGEPQMLIDPGMKYERDQLLDVLRGCQRDRLGHDSLPDF